jgi:hypothetical protein
MLVDFGIPGLEVSQGDHVCAFYHGIPDRDEVLLPFLRAGLAAGDKCICVLDGSDPDRILGEVRAGPGAELKPAAHQLDVLAVEQAYLLTGSFASDRMLDFWDDNVSAALRADGFTFVRSVGDTSWAFRRDPGTANEMIVYESRLNRFLPLYPQVILCLYDLELLSGEMIVDVVKTHPRLLVQGAVVENPDYLEPDEFLASRS